VAAGGNTQREPYDSAAVDNVYVL